MFSLKLTPLTVHPLKKYLKKHLTSFLTIVFIFPGSALNIVLERSKRSQIEICDLKKRNHTICLNVAHYGAPKNSVL